jgi:hypothetical protein
MVVITYFLEESDLEDIGMLGARYLHALHLSSAPT